MWWIIILGLVGLAFGADELGRGGWLIGLAIGALLGYCIKLSRRVSELESTFQRWRSEASTITPSASQQQTEREPVHGYPDTQPESAPDPKPKAVPTQETITPVMTPTAPYQHDADFETQSDAPARDPWQSRNEKPITAPGETFNPFERVFQFISNFFTQGNPVVRIGVVVLFFGVSFLLKYAAEHSMLPIELRLIAVACGAIAMMVVGWKLRTREGQYGLVLQGGGIGLLYALIFAAAKYYTLFPLTGAFAMMFLVVMLGSLLAVLQNALSLALLASVGGYLAPILTSSGDGNHIALFTYYLLLNTGILLIAWFKAWRLLNLTSFAFTFVVATAWGVLRYNDAHYLSSQLFLIAFFLQFLAISFLFAVRQPPELKGLIDGSLVFGLPLLAFGLQNALVGDWPYALAISALALAAVYILLAAYVLKRTAKDLSLLGYSYLCLGGVFATIAVPLALDAQWTAATWALEGVGLLWVGLQQRKLLPRLSGYLLQILAFLSLLSDGGLQTGDTAFIQGDYLGLILVSVSAVVIAWLLDRFTEHCTGNEAFLSGAWLGAGLLLFSIAQLNEMQAHLIREWRAPSFILYSSVFVTTLLWLKNKLPWQRLHFAGFALLPVVALSSFSLLGTAGLHPFGIAGALAYGVFYVCHYRLLRSEAQAWPSTLQETYHAIGGILLLLLLFRETQLQLQQFADTSLLQQAIWLLVYSVPVVLSMTVHRIERWPFSEFPFAYRVIIPALPLALSVGWFISATFRSGVMPDMPFVPVLNVMDLGQLAVMLLLVYANKNRLCALDRLPFVWRVGVLAGMGFVVLNAMLLRALHYYLDIPYTAYSLWRSMTVQMALSILWTILALLAMYLAKRWQQRQVWMVGAGLLGIVLMKLFFKELADSGTLTRIVSFLVVGALMLLIGYISPLPPKAVATEKTS